ncbi:MAG: urease accessory protein UreD [Granulosicoccus sp.]|nr:urease accessory protein UreD [Granulosicoccus sp.]
METKLQRQRLEATACVSSILRPSEHATDSHQRSTLDKLYQQGSARIRLPAQSPDRVEAVLLNTAGGLTGDDRIRWEGHAARGSRLTITTAACEKIYRSHGPAAWQQTDLTIDSQARLCWLPQECIVFDGARLNRTLNVNIHPKGRCLLVESFVFGRQAMQESFDNIQIHDRWRVYRDEQLLHAEDFRIDTTGTIDAQHRGIMRQFSAMSTVVLLDDQPEEWFFMMKARVDELPKDCQHHAVGATVLPGRLVVRMLATDSFNLRLLLIPCIELLNPNEPIPTVWRV